MTLVPVLMGYFIRGRIPPEQRNPLNRVPDRRVPAAARRRAAVPVDDDRRRRRRSPSPRWFRRRGSAASSCRRSTRATCCTCRRRCPGCRRGKAAELLQQTDRLIKSVPEVARVFGKAGRAETATDPAPLEMFETVIQFKPQDQWRPGMTRTEADRGARPRRPGARDSPTSGCRRSATASTCWPPASRAPSASRWRVRPGRDRPRGRARSSASCGRCRASRRRSPSG